MHIDQAEGMVFRPPSEANSLILRITIGCSHNKCTFCAMYNTVKFRIRPWEEITHLIKQAATLYPDLRRVFLADGNALILPADKLIQIVDLLYASFPKLTRVTTYGGPQDIIRKSPDELKKLRQAGLTLIYLGIESGDDEVLQLVNKGATTEQMITAGRKIIDADMKLSTMVILGLGGKAYTDQHAINTAKVINAVNPTMLSALTLMLHPGTVLRQQAEAGEFIPLSPYELMLELQKMVENLQLHSPCIFRSNHASNLLPLAGTLPQDKAKLLADIEQMLHYVKDDTTPIFNDTGMF